MIETIPHYNCMEIIIQFQSFLKGETQIPSDEAFQIAVTNFAEVFLKSERVTGVVIGGGLSYHDCREIFRHQIEKVNIKMEFIAVFSAGLLRACGPNAQNI